MDLVTPESVSCQAGAQNFEINLYPVSSGPKKEPITQPKRLEFFQATHPTPAAQEFDPVMRRETEMNDVAVSLEAFAKSNDTGKLLSCEIILCLES